ncbi:hypothetical protein E2C01_093950 [Portunus trituberculatus]|uniref:Uncharacterized protein n=1 Tax=Portunus trituberculatus TaxID=210409 RepID=A0A5B7JW88_PORTR|nr:hypothetical protein [Portunus trituberculatus]
MKTSSITFIPLSPPSAPPPSPPSRSQQVSPPVSKQEAVRLPTPQAAEAVTETWTTGANDTLIPVLMSTLMRHSDESAREASKRSMPPHFYASLNLQPFRLSLPQVGI